MNITCAAPLTSILIDTNKGIRPCCYYQAGFLGNLNKNSIDLRVPFDLKR